jgi:hypothetical protein
VTKEIRRESDEKKLKRLPEGGRKDQRLGKGKKDEE